MMPALISIVGKKGSGKAEVLEALITLLTSRDFEIGVLKHIAREDIEIDQPGKDSYRYRMSGAQKVILAGRKRLAVFANLEGELPLEEIVSMFRDFDLVFLEGYVQNDFPKIEVHKKELGDFLLTERVSNVAAVCSNSQGRSGVPSFTFEEFHKLADLIERRFLKKELGVSACSI
jgi:molybdopterin-guanine dinucleotide biosynthesis protein B